MAETLEALLRQARLDKKITINDIAKELKIRKEHFKQFEKKIPAQLGVYERGYLRSYAKYLGVDMDAYIASKKSKVAEETQENEESYREIFVKAIKTPAGKITLVLSVILAIASGTFLWANQHKLRPAPLQEPEEVTQSAEYVVPVKSNIVVEKKGPYEYSIIGISSDSDINITARADTGFTITDASKAAVISSGSIKAGERLFIPKNQDSKIFASLEIKTSVPDALEIQQISDGK